MPDAAPLWSGLLKDLAFCLGADRSPIGVGFAASLRGRPIEDAGLLIDDDAIALAGGLRVQELVLHTAQNQIRVAFVGVAPPRAAAPLPSSRC